MRNAYEKNRRYFRQAYETGLHGWGTTEPSPFVIRSLTRVTQLTEGRRLLDLGCGEGRHCIFAAQTGFQPTGVDFEPLALSRAEAAAREAGLAGHIQWLAADVLSLSFPAASFDVVLDYGCLHHQKKSDWPCYLALLLTVLKPGGYFILSTFSTAFGTYGPQKRPWHLAQGAYRRFFTAEGLHALFDRDFEFLVLEEEREGQRGFWHALMKRRS